MTILDISYQDSLTNAHASNGLVFLQKFPFNLYVPVFAAEKLRVQEDLFRLRAMRKEGEMRREHLLNKAKMLQARATKHKEKVRE